MLSGWSKYRTVVIDHTKIDADLTNYPLAVLLSASAGIGDVDLTSIFTELGASGLKIAIAPSDDVEQYIEEVEWTSGTPFAELWTKVLAVSSASDTTLYIYYDSTHADNSTYVGVVGSTPGKAVWDANFVERHAMNDNTTSAILGSTSVNYTGTKKGANEPAVTASGIGSAQNFDGTDDIVTVADHATLSALSTITVEVYFNQDVQGNEGLVSKFGSANNNREWSLEINAGILTFWETVSTYPTNYLLAKGTADLSDTNYHYGAVTWDGTNATGHIIIYADGTAEALTTDNKTGTGATAWNSSAPVEIGRTAQSNTYCFDGKISEVRISNIVRSAAYIKANQYCFTDAFLTFGAEQLSVIVVTSSLIMGLVVSNTRNLTMTRTTAKEIGLIASNIIVRVVSTLGIIGLIHSATRVTTIARSSSKALGLVKTNSRLLTITKSTSQIIGLIGTNIIVRVVSTIGVIGLVHTASRALTMARSSSKALGLVKTNNRAATMARTSTKAIGLVHTASRLLGIARSTVKAFGLVVSNILSHVTVRLYIEGTRYDPRTDSVSINNVLTEQIDTCEFTIDSDSLLALTTKTDVYITGPEGGKLFGGLIANIDPTVEGVKRVYKISCQDYSVLMDSTIVNKIFENKTDAEILEELSATYLREIDCTTYVSTGETIDKIVFNHRTFRQAVEQLCVISGFDYYVDADKYLHYFDGTLNAAPFGLSDTPNGATTRRFKMADYTKDSSQLCNVITVIGGSYWSPDETFYLPANGVQTELATPYALHHPSDDTALSVWKNTGSDETPAWTALTVGIDYIGSLTDYDCLHNFNEKLLKFAVAPPDLNLSIKIKGCYDVPIIVVRRSTASYALYGRRYSDIYIDKNISTVALAQQQGDAIIVDRAFEKESGTAICWDDGLQAGQYIHIKDTLRNIDGDYLIRKVSARLLGNSHLEYSVEFGEYNSSLIDLLVSLKRAAKNYSESTETEVVQELLESSETFTLADPTPSCTDTGPGYYTDPTGGEDPIISGFWKAS